MNRRMKSLVLAVGAACASMTGGSALAAKTTIYTPGPPGLPLPYWSIAANWSNGVPASGDTVILQNISGDNVGWSNMDVNNTLATAYSQVQVNATGTRTMQMNMGFGANLFTTDMYVATFAGGGHVQHDENLINVSGTLAVGYSAGTSGTYVLLRPAATLNTGTTLLGRGGAATFTHNNGAHNNAYLTLGHLVGGSGSYALMGGTLNTTNTQAIGDAGSGSFTQTGGTNNATYLQNIGQGAGGVGTYTHSAGSNTAAYVLNLGGANGATGTYNLSGTAALGASYAFLGSGGTGTGIINQSGGTANFGAYYVLANTAGSTGTYNLSGGTLSAGSGFVGHAGTGNFHQTGDTHVVSGALQIGWLQGGNGTYTLDAGTFSAASVGVGVGSGANGATGQFWQNGGTSTIGSLGLGQNGNYGTYGLSGGVLNVGNITGGSGFSGLFVSGGTLNFTGSSIHVSNLQLTGSGSFALGAAKTLWTDNATDIDGNAAPQLTQTGGNFASGGINIGSNSGNTGTFALSGGTATTGTVNVATYGTGTMLHSGGTLTATAVKVGRGNASYPGSGTYRLSGAGVLNTSAVEVGNVGSGAFLQTGGTATVGTLTLGQSGAFGSVLLSGGVFNVGNIVSGNGFALLGINGGTLNLTGSSIRVSNLQLTDNGSFTLVAGKTLVTDAATDIDGSAAPQLSQTGGSFTSAAINIGSNSGNTGTFALSGGTATTGTVRVATYGTGTVLHSGGTLGADAVKVGGGNASHPGSGTYRLSGSGVLNAPLIEVGNIGQGLFVQSGGTNTVATLRLAQNGSGGTYLLSGGALNLGNIETGTGFSLLGIDGGTLNFTGSSISVGQLFLASAVGSAGTINLKAGQTLTSLGQRAGDGGAGIFNQTGGSNIDGSFIALGGNAGGVGTYNQSGGAASTIDLVIGQGGTGVYNLSGGSLTVDRISGDATRGTFNLNGGTLVVNQTFSVGNLNIGAGASYDKAVTVATAMVNNGSYTLGSLLTVGGSLDNSGVLAMAGGTLTGAGALANNALMTGRGTISGTGGFSNNSLLQQSGGNLLLSNAGTNTNTGQWELLAGFQLQLGNQTTLVNGGSLDLKSGSVTGTGSLNNWSTGTITGNGTISSVFANNGSLVIDSGTTNVTRTFTNGVTGQILLGSNAAALSGGSISNSGLIQGFGKVNNAIVNTGTVEAAGGTLTLAGSLTNTGTLTANSGAKLLVAQGLASNAGTLQLAGGSFDNNGVALVNATTGSINGAGTLRAGAITNNGKLQLSGGGSSVYGNLVSNALSKVILSGNSNGTFYGTTEIKAGAELRVSAGSVATFFGRVFQRSGSSFTGTGAKFYEGGLAIGGSPGLGTDAGDVTFGVDSSYEAEIGGLTACTLVCDTDTALRDSSFDKYQVAGHLGLGGTLKITSWNGYVGQVGQQFDLLDWGTASGTFSHIDSSGFMLAQGAKLDLSQLYTSGAVSITAVPEPSTYAMLLAGIGLVGWRARRRGLGQRAA